MKKITIFDTTYAEAMLLREKANQSAEFLVRNKSRILLSEQDIENISSMNFHVKNFMTDLYQHIVRAGKLDKFALMAFDDTTDSIPEMLTYEEITIDGALLPASLPSEFKTAWVNITSALGRRDRTTRGIVVSDYIKLAELVVRAALVMSYHDNPAWLEPRLAVFVIESYSMSAAMLLKRIYNLDPNEEMFIQTLFATYFAQLMSDPEDDMNCPSLLSRCSDTLGSIRDIKERLSVIEDLRGEDGKDLLVPKKLCGYIAERGPSRMRDFDAIKLYSLFSTGAATSQSMLFAIDFPPYWVYNVIRVLTGAKNFVLSNIFKMGGLKTKAARFAVDINTSPMFIDKIKR